MVKKLVPAIGIVVLAAGGIVLGILQYRWINQVSRSEEERIRREMRMNLVQALGNSGDEVRLIVSLFQPAGGPPRSLDEQIAITEQNIEYWKEVALFPDLMAGGYFFSPEMGDEIYVLENGTFSAGAVPEELLPVIEAAKKRGEEDEKDIGNLLLPMYRDGFILISYGDIFRFKKGADNGETGEVEEKGEYWKAPPAPPFIGFCRIDLSVLFEEVIPYYVSSYLESYAYTITFSDGAVPGSRPGAIPGSVISVSVGFSNKIGAERKPEITVPLSGPLSLGHPRFLFPDRNEGGGSIPAWNKEGGRMPDELDRQSPFLAFLLSRSLGRDMMGIIEESAPIALVSVFYPDRPLEDIISARKSMNLAVSFGIVAVLFLSSLVMFRIYTKTGELRAREQEFVASMSHELRTPISVIQSASDNLADGVVGEVGRVKTYGKLIQEQTVRLTRMVEGILAYAGLSSGKHSRAEKVDPVLLCSTVVESLRPSAAKAGAAIGVSFVAVPAFVKTDPSAVRLILENLLINALRHGLPDAASKAPPGYRGDPVRLEVTCSEKSGKGSCTIVVEDHGRGVPAKEAGKIFEPFFRGDQALKEQREGTGLGLHLVKRVVTLLDGTLKLESPYESSLGIRVPGCRFTVELPVEEIREDDG